MPRVVEYQAVERQMAAQRFVSLYPNSGAFGYPRDIPTHSVGWITGDDPTIRPAARELTISVAGVPQLVQLASDTWQDRFPGDAWIMPKAHWAYELDFGSGQWMPDLLRSVGVDAGQLGLRHDGSALAFESADADAFARVLQGLLENLLGSDFQLVFPNHDLVCTIHHHRQLWWTSPNADLIASLRLMAS